MAKLYADESVALGAPFGMKYAEEYAVYDPPGNATEWNTPRPTILDGIGVRLAPGIRAREMSSFREKPTAGKALVL